MQHTEFTRDTRPALMDEAEARRFAASRSTSEIMHRVADKGYWREDQFGIDWASHEAQEKAKAELAAATTQPSGLPVGTVWSYDRGSRVPVGFVD